MAYLLGSEMLMESLRTDVQDIHWAVCDIFSRTGPVRQLSWKFPDKMSCDVDIDELLELYSHGEDEEERQVAHIALYELVIDRSGSTQYSTQILIDGLVPKKIII